jgi:hypothetical protein
VAAALGGCAGGPPPRETRPLPTVVREGDAAAVAGAVRAALEAAGWAVERAEPAGVVTRLREEPEDFSWQLDVALVSQGRGTEVVASLVVVRAEPFRPVQALLRNNARMQVDDQYLETGNRRAYEGDHAQIEANSPEGRRETALRRLEERVRGVLRLPAGK